MPSKIADITVSLRLTSRQLQRVIDTLEMEVDRTVDNEGFCGCDEDERENLEFRCDLLDALLQIANQTLMRGRATHANADAE